MSGIELKEKKIFGGTFTNVFVIILLALLYYLLRIPTQDLPLLYKDNGETLYHTMAILEGLVPYKDDFNHHFCGYLLPYILFGKIFGVTPALIQQVALVNQVLLAFGVYLVLRRFVSFPLTLIGALLTISAKEPMVYGFFIQQQINLLMVYTWYCCLGYEHRHKERYLYLGCLLAGLSLVFDQRALFLVLVPLMTIMFMARELSFAKLLKICFWSFGFYVLPIFMALCYLALNGALWLFIEQTFLFPLLYRASSKSLAEVFQLYLSVHGYLIRDTVFLVIFGVFGFFTSFIAHRHTKELQRSIRLMLFWSLPLFVMPVFGGRDYDYYTVTWLPYLAIMAVLASLYFSNLKPFVQKLYHVVLCLPVLVSLLLISPFIDFLGQEDITGDGGQELVSFLKEVMQEDETVFIWGYRFDIYIELAKLSPYPFANTILVHPDKQILGEENRKQHIYHKYERLFLKLLEERKPDYIVTFVRGDKYVERYSPAQERISELLENEYKQVFSFDAKDVGGQTNFNRVYALGSSVAVE